ncbi:hypothetical protein F441_08204 [Phytophthora nicotianae CJ01A1]|uniref:Uncharacterized protein n=1 Tax=Phytophthora nicotianae CJ01A1 TaxID=1317063 RepID=W2X4E6_PHYNI|nr:hypothetical protein F441_08204 [Phytophthora nicotianae CJ01A1]
MSSDDRPNIRFACREHSLGSEDEAKARSFRSVTGSFVEGHTPVPSEHSVDSLHSFASDHVDYESKTPERSESRADETEGSPNAGGDEGGKPPKNLSLAEGLEHAQAAKSAAEEAKHSKKRMASRSPLREGEETDAYYTMFDSSDEEDEGAIDEPREITIKWTDSRSCSKLLGESLGDRRRRLSARQLPSTRDFMAYRGELWSPLLGRAQHSSWAYLWPHF